jgi:hypothetical protein
LLTGGASDLLRIVRLAQGDTLDVGECLPGLGEFKNKQFERSVGVNIT